MKRGSRREFLFSSLLISGVVGCSGHRNIGNDELNSSYEVDEKKVSELEERAIGVIVSSKRAEFEKYQRVLEVQAFSDDKDYEHYFTISVQANKNRHNGLSLDLIQDNCIGDIIKFPTRKVAFDYKTGEYSSDDYFKDGGTYAVIDIDRVTISYNPEREKFRDNIRKR